MQIQSESLRSREMLDVVIAGMRRQSESHLPWESYADLTLVMRSEASEVIAAALGETGRGWLHLSVVWVHESFRDKKLGSHLVHAAEEEARRRGCHSAYLDTFSYQAKPFYEKLGYAVFGTLDDYPQGHQKFYMSKRL